jgi:arginine decarboxylase
MDISLTTGTGTGPTPLAAFDAAVHDAGLTHYNMIYMSCIIPTGSVIKRQKGCSPPHEYGHRLYVVMSRQDCCEPGQAAWAGIGWVQDAAGRGLFVEHHGTTEAEVKETIRLTLESMMPLRDYEYGPIQYETIGVMCEDQPVSAVAIAVYKSQDWDS